MSRRALRRVIATSPLPLPVPPSRTHNYPLKGLPPGSPRRLQWQAAATSLGLSLADFIRTTIDIRVLILQGAVTPERGIELMNNLLGTRQG